MSYTLAEAAAEVRAIIADLRRLRQERDRWHDQADHWRGQAQPLALPEPGAQPAEPLAALSRLRRAWRWMRATGCLVGAGLLLALSTVPAGAQQQFQPQPQSECFIVVGANNLLNIGAILLDRCTGKTWSLGRTSHRACCTLTKPKQTRRQHLPRACASRYKTR
jgi:hypothetical protein